jgi:hypothetical protein
LLLAILWLLTSICWYRRVFPWRRLCCLELRAYTPFPVCRGCCDSWHVSVMGCFAQFFVGSRSWEPVGTAPGPDMSWITASRSVSMKDTISSFVPGASYVQVDVVDGLVQRVVLCSVIVVAVTVAVVTGAWLRRTHVYGTCVLLMCLSFPPRSLKHLWQ